MEQYIVDNPVPTPEQMADKLGVSRERLEAIRAIMRTPVRRSAAKSAPISSGYVEAKITPKKKASSRAKTAAR